VRKAHWQFAPDAPAGRRFTEEEVPDSPAMPEAMTPIARQLAFQRAEAQRAAELEAEKEADLLRIEAEAMRQRQEQVLAEAERARQEEERPLVARAGASRRRSARCPDSSSAHRGSA